MWIDWTKPLLTRLRSDHRPRFYSPPKELLQTTLSGEITQESILYNLRNGKHPKCLSIISATTSTLSILLIMCGVTLQWPTRSREFWPGYLHSNPRNGTTISKPVGSTTWETGSWRLRNIGIGLVVAVRVILVVQPCFATEVQELVKHTLGKRENTRGNKGIANKL